MVMAILVDSRSKWPEILHMKSTTSAKVIVKLSTCFAAYGLPNTVVTDGGTQFTPQEFNDFFKFNGIRHLVSPPYHPASNGLAERMVQTTKSVFLKQLLEEPQEHATLDHRHDIPAEMFLKTIPRTPLSLLKPHFSDDMKRKQEETKTRGDTRRGKQRSFNKGDMLLVRTVRQEKINWQSGVIFKVVSPVTYLVNVEGKTRFVHADHLKLNPSRMKMKKNKCYLDQMKTQGQKKLQPRQMNILLDKPQQKALVKPRQECHYHKIKTHKNHQE
ncbi:uncharacterized protein K02A2.6-like [Macrosteles quadrilineatus]|uniref:uncharacterized protein K02A2.6-like n=1 Tax=Macrosteles quadrilineatus TaxID=74068 RepID=UPI0023E23E4A|nr:uncharacterized protein K02A2.6-like [Macrosteles quadrilineatus]